MKYLPLLVFLMGIFLALAFGIMLAGQEGQEADSTFLFTFGLFSYLALMGWLGRLVAISEKKDLGMFISFVLGPIGVVVAAMLRSDGPK